jgi:dihydroxyacetone kinase
LALKADDYQIDPKRIYSGTFMTSLNGNGFSISLLRIADTGLGAGRDMISLLDAAHETLGWAPSIRPSTRSLSLPVPTPLDETEKFPSSALTMDVKLFTHTVTRGLTSLIAAEPLLTRYDTLVGDGDCGNGLKRGAQAVQSFLDSGGVTADPVSTISRLATIIEESMDGTSGALTSIYLNAFAKALRDHDGGEATVDVWAKAAVAAMHDMERYTPAQPGDRTMMDALAPFLDSLQSGGDLKAAARKAREGAEKTRGMVPKLGRTVYIDSVGDIPDPGAVGIAVLVEGFAGI